MKLVTMALVCLLVAGMWPQDVNSKSLLVQTSSCCYKSVNRSIVLSAIQCYRNISTSCPYRDRVIFKMRRDREICAPKDKQWVKDYLSKLTRC